MKTLTLLVCTLLFANPCLAAVTKTCGTVYQTDCDGKVIGVLEMTRLTATYKIPTAWNEIRRLKLPDTLWYNNPNENCLDYDPKTHPYLKFDYVGFEPVYLSQEDLEQNQGKFSVEMQQRKELSCQ